MGPRAFLLSWLWRGRHHCRPSAICRQAWHATHLHDRAHGSLRLLAALGVKPLDARGCGSEGGAAGASVPVGAAIADGRRQL